MSVSNSASVPTSGAAQAKPVAEQVGPVNQQTLSSSTEVSPPAPPSPPEVEEVEAMFNVRAMTFIGSDHLEGEFRGYGNQDALGYRATRLGWVLVTSDGCSDAVDSYVGSRAAVQIVLNSAEGLLNRTPLAEPEQFASDLEADLLHRIRRLAVTVSRDGDINNIILRSYLFTLMVTVVTPKWTAIFACGDGLFAVNGQLSIVEPREGNLPEYIAYLAMKPVPEGFESIGIRVVHTMDTADIKSILIATDGLKYLHDKHAIGVERTFPVSDLWSKPTLGDKQALRDLFLPIQQSTDELKVESKPDRVTVRKSYAVSIFPDDTTFICLVREAIPIPAYWTHLRGEWTHAAAKAAAEAKPRAATPVIVSRPARVSWRGPAPKKQQSWWSAFVNWLRSLYAPQLKRPEKRQQTQVRPLESANTPQSPRPEHAERRGKDHKDDK